MNIRPFDVTQLSGAVVGEFGGAKQMSRGVGENLPETVGELDFMPYFARIDRFRIRG